jgi:bifunctional DNA-binding transcriptional regulator/antitoxin component of YhaV-PrlF toxin-antitoxin module
MTPTDKITFLNGKASCLVVIPRDIAKKQGIYKPSKITIEETKNGIIIKRLAASDSTSSAVDRLANTDPRIQSKESALHEERI